MKGSLNCQCTVIKQKILVFIYSCVFIDPHNQWSITSLAECMQFPPSVLQDEPRLFAAFMTPPTVMPPPSLIG